MNISPCIDALYFGVLLSTVLLGVSIVQGWIYLNTNNDRWLLRLLIATLYLLDFAITALYWQNLHHLLINNFGNPATLLKITPEVVVALWLVAVIVSFTRLLFASQLYLCHKSNLWPPAIVVLSGISTSVIFIYQGHRYINAPISIFSSLPSKLRVGIGFGLASVADLVIMITMYKRLSSYSAHSEITATQTLLQRLLLWTLTRGLLATSNQLIFVIVFLTTKAEFLYWVPFLLLFPKLYIMTTVAMLNARKPSGSIEVLRANFPESQLHGEAFNSLHMKALADGSSIRPHANPVDVIEI